MSCYPKISIVTPNYNQGQFLEQTILSVLNQDYPNLEYIVIDGGSTDNSVDIIKKYSHRLAYWISEPDSGMYEAIQKGFDKCTGEIMAWINSDDMYHNGALSVVAEIFSSFSNVNWLVGAATQYDELGRTIYVMKSKRVSKFDFYLRQYEWIQQESTFWRRSLWEKSGASVNFQLKYAGDFALWILFFSHEKLFIVDALIGGFRRRRSNQLSLDNLDEYLIECERILNQVVLTEKDKLIIRRYRMRMRIAQFLQKFKLLRTDWLLSKFRKRYFSFSEEIVFDSREQKFKMLEQ